MRIRDIISEAVDLKSLEKAVDKIWEPAKVDVVLPQRMHFGQQVDRKEHSKSEITDADLMKLFSTEYQQHGDKIANLPNQTQAVMTDTDSNINIPFILKHRRSRDGKKDRELTAKTILKKPNFKTDDDQYLVPDAVVKVNRTKAPPEIETLKRNLTAERNYINAADSVQAAKIVDKIVANIAKSAGMHTEDLLGQWSSLINKRPLDWIRRS